MAPWWARLVAFVIDELIVLIPCGVILSVAGGSTTVSQGHYSVSSKQWVGIGLAFIVTLGYFSFLDGSRRGQTVGKMAMGIAVRDVDNGGPIGAGRSLGRRAFFFATYLGFGILFVVNALSPLWDPHRRGWHDKVARSCVVSVR